MTTILLIIMSSKRIIIGSLSGGLIGLVLGTGLFFSGILYTW